MVSVAANDQLLLARYEQSRIKLAKELEERLTFLTSPLAQDAWRYFLSTTQDWNLAIGKFIKLASLDPNDRHSGKKIDVWRTEEPEVFSGIYLNSEEISAMLNHLDFSSMRDLAMGSHWRAAIDLPSEMITWHVIPAITIALRAKTLTSRAICWLFTTGTSARASLQDILRLSMKHSGPLGAATDGG
ncbi:hypothetical protein N8D55_06465 [Xanthomonas hortorum pv. pelargonii]|nr:hypothetical protein N8D55_06465 [Xanthomonas hortorum pv. pelargonii]